MSDQDFDDDVDMFEEEPNESVEDEKPEFKFDLSILIEEGQSDDNQSVSSNESTELIGNPKTINKAWTSSTTTPVHIDFTGKEELNPTLLTRRCYDIFLTIFDEALMEKIANKINDQAKKALNINCVTHDLWKTVDTNELKKLLALSILMGHIKMPTLRSYWSQDFIYMHPIFGSAMPGSRFELILRCLPFLKENDDEQDDLPFIYKIIEHVVRNINNLYSPPNELTIDKGLNLHQRSKSNRSVNKFYEIASKDGYVLDMLLCTGTAKVDRRHTFNVVRKLTENFLAEGHTIYLDISLCSVEVLKYLIENKTYACGFVKSGTFGLPSDVTRKCLKKEEYLCKENGNVKLLKWRDAQKNYLIISSKHDNTMTEVNTRKAKKVMKPTMIVEHNDTMKAQDRVYQMLLHCSAPGISINWHSHALFRILDVCLWNAMWLSNKINVEKISYLKFREIIIKEFLRDKIAAADNQIPGHRTHYLKKLSTRKRCRECSKNKRRSSSQYVCDTCVNSKNEPIGLCVDCFKCWHEDKASEMILGQ
jgi:hypothetical protein